MINRSEIWDVILNPTRGAEMKKSRPCVVISNDKVGRLPLRVIVPITKWHDSYESAIWMVKLEPNSANGLTETSAVDTFQIRSVSVKRFVNRRGVVSAHELSDIVSAVGIVIDISI